MQIPGWVFSFLSKSQCYWDFWFPDPKLAFPSQVMTILEFYLFRVGFCNFFLIVNDIGNSDFPTLNYHFPVKVMTIMEFYFFRVGFCIFFPKVNDIGILDFPTLNHHFPVKLWQSWNFTFSGSGFIISLWYWDFGFPEPKSSFPSQVMTILESYLFRVGFYNIFMILGFWISRP